jgi:uncharacterized protein
MGEYRLKPSLLNALIVVVVYALILIGMQKLSGVPYTEITKSTANLAFGVLIPVGIGSIIITVIALWSGWWKDVWRDKYQIKGHSWMHIFLILGIVGIVANLLAGNIGSLDMAFIGVALIATAFVGYSEELLTRGLLVQGARASGFTEIKVFLISMVVFGFLHGLNIINGQDIVTTIQQVIFTALAGGVYYTIFRKSGFLVVPMILHGLWDFSLLTQGVSQLNHIAAASSVSPMVLVGLLATWIAYILLIPAARNFNVKKEKIEETKAS